MSDQREVVLAHARAGICMSPSARAASDRTSSLASPSARNFMAALAMAARSGRLGS